MFTYFTDRDGKYQLGTLKESAFDPLARTCEFMLKEEAHHMFVGTTGVQRTVERTAQLMVQHQTTDIFAHGGIPLDVIQKYLNFQFSVSMDLFGSEQSSNAAAYYTGGLKGRWQETRRKDDHVLKDASYAVRFVRDGKIVEEEVPALTALNLGQIPVSLLLIAFAKRLEGKRWPMVASGVLSVASIIGMVATTGAATVLIALRPIIAVATSVVFRKVCRMRSPFTIFGTAGEIAE